MTSGRGREGAVVLGVVVLGVVAPSGMPSGLAERIAAQLLAGSGTEWVR